VSGVVGVYFLDGRPVGREVIERMTDSITHRGPDGVGIWNSGPVGLGHRMLWTTPESLHEQLPLEDKAGKIVLTADARIDNRDELIAALDLPRHAEREISDSELILRAYEKWGEQCPEKLLGDFAFAIWDDRRQHLFLSRDHFGVKPLYYYRSDRLFVCASEIKALLCVPEVPRRLNDARVADYLVPMMEDKAVTFYREIFRLPPGHSVTISREGAAVRPYWSFDPSREIRFNSDGEYAEAFRHLFTEAVRCRLRSAFPVGSMLSGGLDSSSVVCMARALLRKDGKQPLRTFSATFDDVPECDEQPFINAVLAQDGLEPHFVRADRISPLTDLVRVFHHEDEAVWVPNLFMLWGGVYNAARQQGVRVLLDGCEGDITVSHGYAHLADLTRRGRWWALMTEVVGLSKNLDVSLWKILWRLGIRPVVPEPVVRTWRVLRRRQRSEYDINSIIKPDFARCHLGKSSQRIERLPENQFRMVCYSKKSHWYDLTSGFNAYILEVADKATAAFSIEPRHPFYDRRLAEFCLALPPEQKLHQGWTRVIMRRALAGLLPDKIAWRGGKANLSRNFARGLLAFERETLEDVILNDSQTIEAYVDMTALRKAYNQYVSHEGNADSLTVWKAVTLALWLRHTGLTA
jgi:asparagine synthase (glutamine-hydrolysing)